MSTPIADFEMNFEDSQQAEADKRLFVRFSIVPMHCESESIEQGRPIFKDEEVVEVMVPGSKDSVSNLVTDYYRQRFARQYSAFKAGLSSVETGTPLSALVWLTPSQIMELNALNCRTVEQLAGMPDQLSQKFMGHHAMKQRAQAYLELAKDAAPMLKLQAELEKRDNLIETMQKQIEQLVAATEKTKAKVPEVPAKA